MNLRSSCSHANRGNKIKILTADMLRLVRPAKFAMNFLSDEQYLLILCAGIQHDEKTSARIFDILQQKPDWNLILKDAKRLGMIPLLYKHLSEKFPDYVPHEIMRQLKENFIHQSLIRFRIFVQIHQLVQAMNSRNIPVILLKGSFLAKEIYRDITLRPMSDIDILVKEHDIQKVLDVMTETGYTQADNQNDQIHESRPAYYHSQLHEKLFARKESHLPPFFIPNGVRVEVHIHIFPGMYYDSEIMDQVWKSAEEYLSDGEPVYHLSPEDMLIHLCVHLHESIRDKAGNVDLYWFCDIHEVLKYYEKRIDWRLFCKRAEKAGVSPETGAVLHLIKENWDSPVPDAVLSRIGKGTERLRITTVFYADQDKTHFQYYIIRFRSIMKIPGWRERIYFLLRFIFPAKEYLKERYGLKNSEKLGYYYFIHPFMTVIRMIRRLF